MRVIRGKTTTNQKFKLKRTQQTFVIEYIDSVDDPNKLLRACFQHSMDWTLQMSRDVNMECDTIGMIISSQLLASDIWIPLRPINENTVDAILNHFLKIMQSQTQDGNIYGEPFTVAVTGIRKQDLPKQRFTAGSGRRKFKQVIHRSMNDASIIRVDNNDPFCLFYALELMRIHVSKEMPHQRFSEYRKNHNKQQHAVRKMMRKAKIPRDLPEYTIEEWGPVVQAFYDSEYGAGIYF